MTKIQHSSHFTSPAGRDAEAFAIVNDLSQLISEPTRIPDRSGDKANTLDLFLTSNPDIYANPAVDSPLGNCDHCLITLRHNFVSHQDRSFTSQKIFHYNKADWDSLRTFFTAYSWYSGFSNDPPLLPLSLLTQFNLVWILLFPLLISLVENILQSVKAVKAKNYRFKAWKHHQTPQSRASFVQAHNLCSKTINNAKSPLSAASAIRLLHVKLGLVPSGPKPKFSHNTFVILLFHL